MSPGLLSDIQALPHKVKNFAERQMKEPHQEHNREKVLRDTPRYCHLGRLLLLLLLSFFHPNQERNSEKVTIGSAILGRIQRNLASAS